MRVLEGQPQRRKLHCNLSHDPCQRSNALPSIRCGRAFFGPLLIWPWPMVERVSKKHATQSFQAQLLKAASVRQWSQVYKAPASELLLS